MQDHEDLRPDHELGGGPPACSDPPPFLPGPPLAQAGERPTGSLHEPGFLSIYRGLVSVTMSSWGSDRTVHMVTANVGSES